ncbi:MAG: polysaccharide biosynthesis tyrosine autokinase [Bdellovibrionales bacterium]|nr:polysaccharide biosynthesis tyrosine autokinase [Bdellovibrionales bacterium]
MRDEPTNSHTPVIRAMPRNLPSEHIARGYDYRVPEIEEEEGFLVREYLEILVKYRTLIATVTVIGALLALVYAFSATPLYMASSTIRIGTYEPVLSAGGVEGVYQEKSKEARYLETQLEEIKSISLANDVLSAKPAIRDRFEEKGEPSFLSKIFGFGREQKETDRSLLEISGYENSISTINRYLAAVTVAPVRRTSLAEITAVTDDPKMSAQIANAHAEQYIEWVRQNRVRQQSRTLKFLRGQSDELRDRVALLEGELADYAEENSIVAVNSDENITAQRMAQLNKMLTEATAKRIEADNVYEKAVESAEGNSAGFDDSSVQSMRSELGRLESEYKQLSAKFTPSYPKMVQLQSQIDSLRSSIRQQREQILLGLKSKASALNEEENRLREELEQQKSRMFDLAKRQVQYNVLTRELDSSRELLQSVLRQIEESALAVEGNSSNVSIVDFATIPQFASHPKKLLLLVIGLGAGLAAGVGAAFVLSYFDNTIRNPEDLNKLVQLPNLGVVPSFELEGIGTEENVGEGERSVRDRNVSGTALAPTESPSGSSLPSIAFLSEPKSLAAEAYRTIRTGILLSQAGEPPRTLVVTSAESSEGKTTTALNLAASLASAGGRVVIVDCDLRRPSVGRKFSLDPALPGLVEFLTGQASMQEISLNHLVRRITVIPSGRIPPNPAELLGSVEMRKFLDELARNFDYVVLDSPPILPVTDSAILSRYVDGVIFVVKGGETPKQVIADAKKRLEAVGARILGTVLNDIDVNSGDYYYYNRYYSRYYRQEEGDPGNQAAS